MKKWRISNSSFFTKKEKAQRNIASLKSPQIQKQELSDSNSSDKEKYSLSADVSFGSVSIDRQDQELNTNYTKVTGRGNYNLGNNYNLFGHIGFVNFINLESSLSSEKVGLSSIFPEFGLGISKKINNFLIYICFVIINFAIKYC